MMTLTTWVAVVVRSGSICRHCRWMTHLRVQRLPLLAVSLIRRSPVIDFDNGFDRIHGVEVNGTGNLESRGTGIQLLGADQVLVRFFVLLGHDIYQRAIIIGAPALVIPLEK